MPNPFVRRPVATSKVDVDRPQSLEPIPERVAGPVFPYRGMETHGVEPNADWRDPEEYDGYERGVEVDTEPPPDEPEALPVRIVQEKSSEHLEFVGTQYVIQAGKEHVIPRDVNRKRLRISNINAFVNIYISNQSGTTAGFTGYPLRPNTELEIGAVGAVYVYNAEPVNSVQIGIYYEHAVYAPGN